ncbi:MULTISPECIES: NAD(P)/FAD-dependent oxidoreductase [Luteimonas]|uniref:Kynurenine 3-monooxygenase n=1 Tax=Luteimonas chenhongjianii TaxID=2006110 RepID=A0A290XE63_9GAMM|nr:MULTISPECIES: NAD(P)/FAD-dependent oxidoreductase [Luteimonas]ATD67420.1 kynurenine 3-monooxygenase [Luteimonas chenhongjianii]RPD85861.1 FAD-dependent monooxygenase [Luteimonas sp. 100069]
MNAPARHLTIIGAGLAGALLGILLRRRGWDVDLYEKRGDPRVQGYGGGRSINLALAERGRHALRAADADDAVMRHAIMMRGRMVHVGDTEPVLQRYGRDDDEVIWSVHRGDLNIVLLDLAEAAGARLHFDAGLDSVNFDSRRAVFRDPRDRSTREVPFQALVGADGAGSALRAAMHRVHDLGQRSDFLDHGYKELEIPPRGDGGFRIEPNALHIWPRGHYMCIALPNDEKTFTVTLFLPHQAGADGGPAFDQLGDVDAARAFFERDFPSALALIPDFDRDWAGNPVGQLATLYLERWHLDGRAVLLGDAAHAMVPFHGQGMNCAFEDCVALAGHLDANADLATAFAAFEAERKPDAAAIQRMALDNYLEMRDRVDDADYLLQRELELALQDRHPGRFVPHYAMVTFMRIPYSLAMRRTDVQRGILERATAGHASLAALDWNAIDAEVLAQLTPLEDVPA